jgi:hypothetical protein
MIMFLRCPAYLDEEGTARCRLLAEVRCPFTLRSSDGPLESAMIRCPRGHWLNGPIEFLTWEGKGPGSPVNAGMATRAARQSHRQLWWPRRRSRVRRPSFPREAGAGNSPSQQRSCAGATLCV